MGNWQARWRYRHIPGPPPSFPLGNVKEIRQKQLFSAQAGWAARYGSVFKFFMLRKPFVCVTGRQRNPRKLALHHQTCSFESELRSKLVSRTTCSMTGPLMLSPQRHLRRTSAPHMHQLSRSWSQHFNSNSACQPALYITSGST